MGFPGGASGKEPTCQCGGHKGRRFDPWSGRPPGGGHGNPLQRSCLENPMDTIAWRATVGRVAVSEVPEHRWGFVCISTLLSETEIMFFFFFILMSKVETESP